MRKNYWIGSLAICIVVFCSTLMSAQDWPQWRGLNRDAITDFDVPTEWPESLLKNWTVVVGDGVSSPSVQGDKVFVMAFQDGNEVMRCLDIKSGKELWKDEYPAQPASGPASGFPGTRSSPAVAAGKVVTMGVNGTISCWDVETGKLAWRVDEYTGQIPRFSTASSPLIFEGTCVVQYGGERGGGIAAYNLKSGDEIWNWDGDGATYGSPVLIQISGEQFLVTPTAQKLVMLNVASGDLAWEMEYRQGRYNAATPVVHGQTVLIAGPNRGITAIEFTVSDGEVSGNEIWRNDDVNTTTMYNTPVLLNGMMFGLSSGNQLFCVNVENGETQWNAPFSSGEGGGEQARDNQRGGRRQLGGRGGRRGGGRGGYGSIVSAGSVLFGLTPASELVVFEPNPREFAELVRYKIAESQTYAYPVPVADGILIKDKQSLALWKLK